MDVPRRPKTRARRAAIPVAVGIVSIVLGTTAFLRGQEPASRLVERSAVWTDQVKRGDLLRQVPVQGTLVPEHIEWLSAVSAARVAHIEVRPGAVVAPDTVVVRLENADLELAALDADHQAASAEAALISLDVNTDAAEKTVASALAAINADLRDATRRAEAAARLAPAGLLSDLDRRDADGKVDGLKDRLATEEARRATIKSGRVRQLEAQRGEVARLREIAAFRKRQLAALEVRARIAGVVQDIPLENGQWVAIGTVLAKVAEPNRLKAEVRVAEGNAREVHTGLSVRFETGTGEIRGHVVRVDPTVVAGSVKLQVMLENVMPVGARADQTVTGYVEVETMKDVLYAGRPSAAREGSSATIFRLEPDHVHARRVSAEFGRKSAREIEITKGLSVGDEILVSDTSAFDAFERIRLQ